MVVIIDYGAGNIQSVKYALERLGVEAVLTSNPDEIKSADKVIFPGVGRAKFAMEKLEKAGLDKLIPTLKQPVLGVCLGMQLMCDHTAEDDTTGLGIFPIEVKEFEKTLPMKRLGRPEEIGNFVKAVIENDIKYLTGVTINFDGANSNYVF